MKSTSLLLAGAVLVFGWFFLFGGDRSAQTPQMSTNQNVTIVGGQQIVVIQARGGYQPQTSVVKAGVPTVLRFVTKGTFDCSSSVRIPSLGISKVLPSSGATDIAIGALSAGTLQGTCSMGMYRFTVQVQG